MIIWDMSYNAVIHEMARNFNYHLLTMKTQLIFGPPKSYCGPKPNRGTELFIYGFPKSTGEEKLIPFFMNTGPIYTARFIKKPFRRSRRVCFLTYFTVQDAKNAMEKLITFKITKNYFLNVRKSIDNHRLFIAKFPKSLTVDKLHEELSQICKGIVEIKLNFYGEIEYIPYQYALVVFEDNRHASIARSVISFYARKHWRKVDCVDFADPRPQDLTFKEKSKIMIVRRVPYFVTARKIIEICRQFLDFHQSLTLIVRKIKHLIVLECDNDDVVSIILEKLNGLFYSVTINKY